MDAYLCIVSRREVRRYADEPIPDDVLRRILEAGRATGSSRNRQRWSMVVVRNHERLARLAEQVAAPDNVRGCRVAIAVVLHGQAPWDGGRLAQNLMLAAWADGVGSCPNTPLHREEAAALLELPAESEIVTILSLGYPAEPVPRSQDAEAILARIDRRPLAELTTFID